MRSLFLLAPLVAALSLGCASAATTHVASDATLGRVVIYRNGIAYFERTADVTGEELALRVPADKVDDFLKSLTVVDAATGQPAPIAYPTTPPGDETGTVEMKIQLTQPAPAGQSKRLKLTYVTEAPSWKPSYRIVLGDGGKVRLEGWAIVDNTSGEDWKSVKLGVGSSSALSFRFDLHSVRLVHRETLAATDVFAQAPPTGSIVAPGVGGLAVLDVLDDETIALATKDAEESERTRDKKTVRTSGDGAAPTTLTGHGAGYGRGASAGGLKTKPVSRNQPADRIGNLARRVQTQGQKQFVVEGFAAKGDADKNSAALGRATKLREQLIANGVAPEQIVAVANAAIESDAGGARVLEAPPPPPVGAAQEAQASTPVAMLDPIGTSHFESKSAMTVPRGTSAMVSILASDTAGEVVYLYDAESERGNARFPFRAVRLSNPTDSTLETGPVTVFGEGRFIGEGLTDPIPGKSTSFVPFALDRQIVVETEGGEREQIARILTVQRGVLSSEVQHVKKRKLTLRNRLTEPATVYVRHAVQKGYALVKSPEQKGKLGEADLFLVTVPAQGTAEVLIEEATPVFKTVDLRAPSGMEMLRVYLEGASLEGPLVADLQAMLTLHKKLGDLEERIAAQREQLGEYRTRMDELHAQLVTLKAVRTAGPLMRSLEKKMDEVSDRVSAATVALVGLEEQRMIARIELQDGLAELGLGKKGAAAVAPAAGAGAKPQPVR